MIKEVIRFRLRLGSQLETLASYEADDAAFHGGDELVARWRKMESTAAESMQAEIWKTSGTREDLNSIRVRST